jgi:LacI family transcriptional regulator
MTPSRTASPTIYDVASLAGLSIATVSRVINTPDRVSPDTRSRVLAAIDQLGFVPKAEARARAMQFTRRIGVLTPFYFTAPSFVQRLRGVASVLGELGYEMLIYTVSSLDQLDGYLASLPLSGHLDGAIIMSMQLDPAAALRFQDRGLDLVTIESRLDGCSSVEIDDNYGGRLAARYLLDRGHSRLGFLGDLSWHEFAVHPVAARLEGFRCELESAGLQLTDEYVRTAPYELEPTLEQARQLLRLPHPPTAVFAVADYQAVAVIRAAREVGMRIPDDLAVLGFDDLDLADFVGLTTVRQPLDDSGHFAAELLMSRINTPSLPAQHIQLPLTIVERETV